MAKITVVDDNDNPMGPDEALAFWTKELEAHPWQFGKIVVTISGSIGTYRRKSEHGVALLHYHNKS